MTRPDEERNILHVLKVLGSCKTLQQIDNAFRWALKVISNEEHLNWIRSFARKGVIS